MATDLIFSNIKGEFLQDSYLGELFIEKRQAFPIKPT